MKPVSLRSHFLGACRFLRLAVSYRRPDRLVYFDGGLGDQLLCTAYAREMQKRRPWNIWMFSDAPKLFEGNRDFRTVLPFDIWLIPWARLCRTRVESLRYNVYVAEERRDIPATEHSIASICRRAGISGKVTLRPYMPGVRRQATERARPRVVVHSSCLAAKYPLANKQWPADRMQAVVHALKDIVEFVQVGDHRDPPLEGAEDLRGRTSLLETASMLADADLFLGLVGFLMHLSRAVECPAVIIYGGREWPEYTGYSCNINLTDHPPCSPCWYDSRCDFERRCLTAISAESVIAAVQRVLSAPPKRPLKEDTAEII